MTAKNAMSVAENDAQVSSITLQCFATPPGH